ncbi:MAG: DUF3570 domain-containing protein [Nitrospirota bacterium]
MAAIKRILVISLICLLIFPLGTVSAEDYLQFSTYYYDIQPNLTITKPTFTISKDISMNTNAMLRVTVDDVKVDGVSGATKSAGSSSGASSDRRKEFAAGISHIIGDWKLEGGYVISTENDYRSTTPSISVSKDFFQRNTTITVGYSHNSDDDLHAPSGSGKRDVNNFAVSLTQVLSQWTVMQAGYTFSDMEGYLASGHRRVLLENGAEVTEYVPAERKREAFGIRIAQWLPTNGSIHLSYRHYRDDWKINSNTYQMLVYQYLLKSLLLRGEYRYYTQDGAYFYKDSYTGTERYLTSTVSLGPMIANLYGLKAVYTIEKANIDIEAKYEKYHQSTGLNGDIFMVGMKYLF